MCYQIRNYCAVVWDNCTIQDSNTLEKLQNERLGKLVTRLTRSVSLVNLYRECGWVTLNTRRKEQKLEFMYKAVNDLTPDYISDLIPHFVRDATNYPLRNNNNLALPFTKTEISRKSCIPSSISLWNSLDEEIRTSNSLSCFKSKLKTLRSDFNYVPHFFLCGERYWSVMQARIRNNCSNLNSDLYLKGERSLKRYSALK